MFILLTEIVAGDGSRGFVLNGAEANDNSGWSVASAGDVNGDGFDDLIIGARYADGPANGRSSAGESYVVFGKAAGFPAAVDLATIAGGDGSQGFVVYGESASDGAGWSVASAGDVNGDGLDDLIVGAPGGDGPADGRTLAGETYVVFSKAGGFGSTLDLAAISAGDGSGGFVLQGRVADERSGWSVASIGDVNGDGFDDVVVGAPLFSDDPSYGPQNRGEAYVVFGKADGFAAAIDAANIASGDGSQGFVLMGDIPFFPATGQTGYSVASAGDVNGDGFDDILVGGIKGDSSQGGTDAGYTYVVYGKADSFGGIFHLADIASGNGSQGFMLSGENNFDYSGCSVASAGDVNGDGFDDLIIGARQVDGPAGLNAGATYVVFGKAAGFAGEVDLSVISGGDGSQGFMLHGVDDVDFSGWSVASAGDVNGDGFDDMIVGAPRAGGSPQGQSYVVFGKAGGFGAAIDLNAVGADDSKLGFLILGAGLNDAAGVSVASAGDLNGDGFDDLVVGAYLADGPANGRTSAGETYVIFGSATVGGSENHLTQPAGGDADDTLTGAAGVADVLVGGRGDDTIAGVGGADSLRGGEGDDRLGVGDASFLSLDGGNGSDTLSLTGAMTLADSGFRRVSGMEDLAIGDHAVNLTLGRNASLAFGGVASSGFLVTIDGTQSVSTAQTIDATSFNHSLTIDFSNNTVGVTVVGGMRANQVTGGSGADDLGGNAGSDTLNGGGGNDILNGGEGADKLSGGFGNDIFYVDNMGDVVVEAAGGGDDRVAAQRDFTLGDGQEVELITTTNYGAVRDIDLKGNAFAQTIVGNNGDNWLHDGGVGGTDTLRGREGNDLYTVYNSGAVIIEARGQGDFDRLAAGVDYVLARGVEIESLRTTSQHAGYSIDLTGNEFGQEIIGNDGDNRIDGNGGNDTIQTGLGNDTVVFSATVGAGISKITDFSVANDLIALSHTSFPTLSLGVLDASAFKDNFLAPRDADDYIIYNSSTGSLFYDADGLGGAAAVKFGALATGLALTAADFVVI